VHASGLGLLDDAAKSCVLTAAAPFPEPSWNRCFKVPVDFRER
jgi:hypothetical protein